MWRYKINKKQAGSTDICRNAPSQRREDFTLLLPRIVPVYTAEKRTCVTAH